jgi:hypothetical protein
MLHDDWNVSRKLLRENSQLLGPFRHSPRDGGVLLQLAVSQKQTLPL